MNSPGQLGPDPENHFAVHFLDNPIGEWNIVDIQTLGQMSVFVINGTPGMVTFNARHRVPGVRKKCR